MVTEAVMEQVSDAPSAPQSIPRRARAAERLDAIDAAIRRQPDAAENYLLRAELLLDRGRRGDDLTAAVDAYRAAALAEMRLAHEDWGIAAQITHEQALALLHDLAERGIVVETAPDAGTHNNASDVSSL